MGFTGDPLKIRKISVTPFEQDEGLYGVSYDTVDGQQFDELIGTRSEAEEVLRKVRQQRRRGLRVISSVR